MRNQNRGSHRTRGGSSSRYQERRHSDRQNFNSNRVIRKERDNRNNTSHRRGGKRGNSRKLDVQTLDRQMDRYWGKSKADDDDENYKNYQDNKKKGLDFELDQYWTDKKQNEQ